MKIAFHVYNFSFRGSEVALFDYALYNQTIKEKTSEISKDNNNVSIIVYPKKHTRNPDVIEKFKIFPMYEYENIKDLEEICKRENVDMLYTIKYGTNDEVILKNIPTFVHCVFTTSEPHGSMYVGVSESVSRHNNNNNNNQIYPILNHIIYLPPITSNYRQQLNIPEDAIVLGRHGGNDTFDIEFVKEAIKNIVESNSNIYFLFAIRPNMMKDIEHSNIIYLDSFSDNRIKRKFINTCDAMIHASSLGESFGLSILEFSFCNKPVITWNGGTFHKQHIKNLGDRAMLYNNKDELINIITNFKILKGVYEGEEKENYWNVTEKFHPKVIIKEFRDMINNNN